MKRAENPRLMRWLEPDSVKEIWHHVYNQQPWATSLVGRDRTTCRTARQALPRRLGRQTEHLRGGPRRLGGQLHETGQPPGRLQLVRRDRRGENRVVASRGA